MDLASTPVIKTDQTRNNPGAAAAALLKNVPTQQGRFLTTLHQTGPATLSSVMTPSSGGSQAIAKQVAMNSSQGIVNRLTPLPVHTTTSSTYHVPRGAAAVANMAVPRSSLATPIRGPSNLQALGVSMPNHSALARGGSSTVGVRSGATATLQVAPTPTWLSNSSNASSTPRPTSSQATHYPRAPPMTVTRLTAPIGSSRVLAESAQRPVLLQTTTHKQLNLNQAQAQQMHINDKGFLKTGVNIGVRPQTTVATTIVTGRPVVPSQAPTAVNRIGTTSLPVVSLHPGVLVQTPSVPLKTQQIHTSKFLTQSPHIQIQPVNSIPPSSTIAVTTVVSKLTSFSTTSTIAGMASAIRPVHNVTTPCPTTKVLASSEQSVFQTAHKPTSSVTVPGVSTPSIVGIGNQMYGAGPYQYEPPTSFQMQQRTSTTFAPTPTPVPATVTPTSTMQRPTSSIVTSGQPVRYNPVMVVDPNRTSIHSYVTAPEGSCSQSVESSSTPSSGSQVQTPTKANASPRPSILRKRDSEGSSPMKAQKNLTPLLSTLTVAPPSSPPSPKRPESRGNGGGQSSGGSTTISATSSPGLGTGDPDSPPLVKQEHQPEPPPVEMSPRKKPRKQQLTGNQMQEPKSEDEMEFISEEKYKKESKEGGQEDAVEPPVPKVLPKRPSISLLNSYRHTWKSRHHHFLRYSDVKPKDERRPTVSDLASQKQVQQKISGWKIYHLSTQMEDLSDLETEVLEKLTAMLKVLERKPGKELDKDINRVNELIKGNIQRCKVIKDQMHEAKTQVMKIFDHKGHVTEILNRCSTKRSVKKRDRV